MVNIKLENGKVLELKFGLGELNAVDKALGLEIEQINLGEGFEMLVPKLRTGNVLALAKIIPALTLGQNGRPKTDNETLEVLKAVKGQYGSFQAFCDAVLDEMKHHFLTQDLVKDESEEETAQATPVQEIPQSTVGMNQPTNVN
ncbi:tail assembly chaperone [Macrococcoides caseolyticum]|uniref:tail assembly chaperone n=1 Tax=Macrococcoides caseolyticum TaxID=69966 RepID=UPI0011A51166|nr:tail assembly chaperone [Macrococcus caseolyticus]